MIPRKPCLSVLLLAVALICTGCTGHRIRGKIVEGPLSGAMYVDKDDPRLEGAGLPDAMVEFTLDPDSMDPKRLGAAMSDGYGEFSLPVDALGAGFLEYEIGVLARHRTHQHVLDQLPLRGGGRWLLITMTRGRDGYVAEPDIVEETLDLGEKLQR